MDGKPLKEVALWVHEYERFWNERLEKKLTFTIERTILTWMSPNTLGRMEPLYGNFTNYYHETRKHMANSEFIYITYIRSTPERVWQVLTTNQLWNRCWMGSGFDSDWKVGSSWRATSHDGTLFDSGQVLENVPNKRLLLKWLNEWKPEFKAEGYSLCAYDIEPVRASVKFTITLSMERSDSKFIKDVSGAWPMVASNFKSLIETGEIALVDNPRHAK